MGSFSGLGIGLSFVFGCILMGLVAELYYLLWWKKRVVAFPAGSSSSSSHSRHHLEQHFSFLSMCWKRRRPPPSNFNSASSSMELTAGNSQQQGGGGGGSHQDVEVGIPTTAPTGNNNNNNKADCNNNNNKGGWYYGEEGIESELMRVHNLSGPPRFLFTIKEENREDLVESEDGRSRKGRRSLSDLLVFGGNGGTPFLTPLSSPPCSTTTAVKGLENLDSCYYQVGHGFNPSLFDVALLSETDISRLRSSPPPKLKFLRDAEEKLVRRVLMEQQQRRMEKGGEVIKEEREVSSLVKVLPLDSSPVLLQEKSSEK